MIFSSAYFILCIFSSQALRAQSDDSLQVFLSNINENPQIIFHDSNGSSICKFENVAAESKLRLDFFGSSVLELLKSSQTTKLLTEMHTHAMLSTGNLILKSRNLMLNTHPVWAIVAHDDFETPLSVSEIEDPFQWNDTRTERCGGLDTMFGGYCNFANTIVSRAFMLPRHSTLRVTARFHFIDRWLGESGFMLVDGKLVWSKSHFHCKKVYLEYCHGINVCGDEKYADTLSQVVEVSIPHNKTHVQVSFGSTLEEDPCLVSWGVDDLVISIL